MDSKSLCDLLLVGKPDLNMSVNKMIIEERIRFIEMWFKTIVDLKQLIEMNQHVACNCIDIYFVYVLCFLVAYVKTNSYCKCQS